MRYTLLEMTQRILEAMSSDEVDSIYDTEESLAVANIIKECYFDIIGRLDLPEKEDIYQLQGSGDNTKPALMYLPDFAINLAKVKYNGGDCYYMPFNDFLDSFANLDPDTNNVASMTVENSQGQEFTFKFENDRDPTWYTSYNDRTLIFNAYNSAEGATLVGAKTVCWGKLVPAFTLENNYVPEIDAQQHQLLLQAAKAQAFVEIKQIENPKAEKKERRNEINAQRTKRAIDNRPERFKYTRYGR